jgi:hypothetical protein
LNALREILPGSELIGARSSILVGRLPAEKLIQVWTKTTSAVVKRGFKVEYRDLEPPRTGIFDGLQIVIDPDVELEMQCFILLHLFGHSVQWLAPSLAEKLHTLQHTPEKTRFMQVLRDYEYEAARFGLQLLHNAGILDLDAWYSDFVATDWRYVERFYLEDRIPPWNECVVSGAPRIEPAPIPPLVHRLVEVRFAF